MSDPVVLPSTIDAVQVFRRGATIVRRAVLEGGALTAGVPACIEVVGLPLSLLDPTARVRILSVTPATTSVTATGLQVGIHVKPGLPPEKAPEQRAIDDVSAQIEELEELVRLVDTEIELLTAIPVPDRPEAEAGRAPPPAPLAMRLALETFVDDAAEARRLERRALEVKIRERRRELEALIERAHAASTAAAVKESELSKSVIVPLQATGPVERVVVEVRYFVPGARWTPAYHVKLARDGSAAVIHHRAHIAQRTGEDWNGVKLSLSTAAPLRFSELPELASVRIGKAQPTPTKRGFRPPPKGGAQLFSDFDRDMARVLAAVPSPAPWSRPDFDGAPALMMDAPRQGSAAPRASAQRASKKTRKSDATGPINTRELAREAHSDSLDDDDALMDMELDVSEERMMVAMAPPAPSRAAARGGPPVPQKSARAAPAQGAAPGVNDVVDAIVFPLLRLPGPAELGGRGRLVPVDTRKLYAESAARCGRPLPFDIASLAGRAEHDAMQAGGAVPPMCIDLADLSLNYDFAYDADGVVDVVADGAWHSVPLGDRDCEASVRYVTVPREELAVYRVAVLQNPLGAPLLQGPAEVYVGGEYVLTTQLPTVAAKGELVLGLGVEQAIKVARNARFKEVREGEGVVSMVELVHDLDVEIVNHLGRTISIEVRERVPVPAHNAEVQVTERGVTPAWEPYDQLERGDVVKGGRRWTVSVAAGAREVLTACYALRLFSNAEVQGGNRREA